MEIIFFLTYFGEQGVYYIGYLQFHFILFYNLEFIRISVTMSVLATLIPFIFMFKSQ